MENHDTFLRDNATDYQAVVESLIWSNLLICVIGVTVVVGIGGNISLCLIVQRQQSLRYSPTFIVLTSMAISDLLLLSTSPLFDIYYGLKSSTPEGIQCYVRLFCIVLSGATILYHLMTFSVFRYLILIHPLFSRTKLTWRSALAVVLVIWIASMAGAGTTLVISGNYKIHTLDNKTILFCAINPDSEIPYGFVLFAMAAPFSVMVGFHFAKIIKLRQNIVSSTSSNHSRKTVSPAVVIAFVLVFCACWLPTILYNVVLFFQDMKQVYSVYEVYPVLSLLIYVNSALNPILYFFLSKTGICVNCTKKLTLRVI